MYPCVCVSECLSVHVCPGPLCFACEDVCDATGPLQQTPHQLQNIIHKYLLLHFNKLAVSFNKITSEQNH